MSAANRKCPLAANNYAIVTNTQRGRIEGIEARRRLSTQPFKPAATVTRQTRYSGAFLGYRRGVSDSAELRRWGAHQMARVRAMSSRLSTPSSYFKDSARNADGSVGRSRTAGVPIRWRCRPAGVGERCGDPPGFIWSPGPAGEQVAKPTQNIDGRSPNCEGGISK